MLFKKTVRLAIALLSIVSSSVFAEELFSVTVTWGVIPQADAYQLEELRPGAPDFEIVYVGADHQTVLIDRGVGEYRYRMIGCIYLDGDPLQPACLPEYAQYTAEIPNIISGKASTRRVIFIHTDLLGSPSAETNEQGELNQ